MEIFRDEFIYIEKEQSEIPWVKIFTTAGFSELTECDTKTKKRVYEAMEICEKTMLSYYKPKKINIAMFGNYLPKLHVHVMARFENDSFFPEPMWGKKQRDGKLDLPSFDEFAKVLNEKLK